MTKFKMFFALIALGITAYGMLHVKQQVQLLTRDLIEVKRQIAKDKEALHILQAEWAYLNQPERLKFLADEYLNMRYTEANQVTISTNESLKLLHGQVPKFIAVKPVLKPTFSNYQR